MDEVERVKYKDGIANKMAYASDEVKTKGNRLDNKQPFGEGDAYDKDVKASPKPHDKEAAAQRAKLAALAARKAMMTNKMSEAETHQAKTTMKHINNPNAAEKKAAKDIKPGIKGYQDRVAMLKAAQARGALKEDELDEDELGKKKKEQVVTVKHKDSGKELRVVKTAVADYQKRGYHPVKEETSPPFDGPYKKSTGDVKDKSGAVHTSASKAKDLAQKGLKNVQDKIKSKIKENFDVDLLSNLYDQLDESNQEIFLTQLEEDAEVLLAFAKTIAEE